MNINVSTLRDTYARRYTSVLRPLANRLQEHLSSLLHDTPHVDSIRARAKTPDRFIEKALKREDGQLKYSDPLNQIQDLVGARIIVFYIDDVGRACTVIERYFRFIEERLLVPESPKEFGYEGKHYIPFIPSDIVESAVRGDTPKLFELQVKTLFQHSWAEADHDLAYKSQRELSPEQRRRVAFTAAQAWGADHIFNELALELGVVGKDG